MAQVIAPVPTAEIALKTTAPFVIRARRLLRSSRPYYAALGLCMFFGAWFLLDDHLTKREGNGPGTIPGPLLPYWALGSAMTLRSRGSTAAMSRWNVSGARKTQTAEMRHASTA